MGVLSLFSVATLLAAKVFSAASGPSDQVIIGPSHFKEGVGHFSEWSRNTKKEFLIDWQNSKESDWILVLGNEASIPEYKTKWIIYESSLRHVLTCTHLWSRVATSILSRQP